MYYSQGGVLYAGEVLQIATRVLVVVHSRGSLVVVDYDPTKIHVRFPLV